MEESRAESHREMLNANVSALRYFGLWAPHPDSSGLVKWLYAFYKRLVMGLMCTFAGTIVADLFANYRDLIIATDDGCFIAGISVVIFKLFNFQIRREKIESLINAIHDPVDWLRCSSDEAVVALVKTFVLYEKTTVYFFSSLGGFLVIALLLFAPTENGSLPIRAKYPFDTTTNPMHHLAFFVQASAVTTAVVAIMAMDVIVLGFCRFTGLQLRVLTSNYENCQSSSSRRRPRRARIVSPRGDLTTSYASAVEEDSAEIRSFVPFHPKEANEPEEDNFASRFKTCVEHHQRLIRIVDDINRLFASSMLVQLCSSSSMICLTGFQALLCGAGESANFTKFALYLGAAFSQLSCWCWFGNKLIHQSDSLAKSQWFSGWEDEPNLSSISVLMIVSLIRAQRSMQLAAGSFYAMSLETFVAILRASYSFFALLSNVNFAGAN